MVDNTSCATCAQYLHTLQEPPLYTSEKSEKPQESKDRNDRNLDCCGRVICGRCIQGNPRFGNYCPFCQISTTPSPLPPGLRDPPSYTPPSSSKPPPTSSSPSPSPSEELPPYTPTSSTSPFEKPYQQIEDTLHFLNHTTDTLTSLSLRYGVPISALRTKNNITSDHLLLARRTILIPGELYKGGVSLSPRPVEGEEEERRKGIVRRWMVGCKVSEYDIALLYLQQASYNLEAAILAYKDDEKWERDHPLEANKKQKGKQKHDLGRRRFTGQRS